MIAQNIDTIKKMLPKNVTLIAVSKKKSNDLILKAYNCNHLDFGENYIQELVIKQDQLPKDIRWHFIGHLQSNKVKYIAPFVYCIHSIDSEKLLVEINKQAIKNKRIIKCLLQIFIAKEETKFGLSIEEATVILNKKDSFSNIDICGFMGMASNTSNENIIEKEFEDLNTFFNISKLSNNQLVNLCIGMSSDFKIALKYGATHIRIGTAIFGNR